MTYNDCISNKIIIGDIKEVLPDLINSGIKYDLVIADPPYNIGKDFGIDSNIMPLNEYADWIEYLLKGFLNLIKDDGIIYLYGLPEIIAQISVRFPVNEQRWLVWHYTNKTVPSSKFWQRSHETILSLWKPNMPRTKLEIDQIREPYTDNYLRNAAGKKRKDTPSRYGSKGKITTYQAHKNGALPRDVIKVPALAGGAGKSERWFICKTCNSKIFPPNLLKNHRDHDIVKHPTQKPMGLTKRLMKSKINGIGGKVLIPFAGSGSECIVARNLNIQYTAIEINAEFAEFANKWLSYGLEFEDNGGLFV